MDMNDWTCSRIWLKQSYFKLCCRNTEVVGSKLFSIFFECFWQPDFSILQLPMVQDLQSRIDLLEHICMKCEHKIPKITNLTYRLHDVKSPHLSLEESYFIKRIFRTMINLKKILLWKVCDDITLNLIGSHCKYLEYLDVWKSSNVSDQGILLLIGDGIKPNPLCQSLLKIVIKVYVLTSSLFRDKRLELNFMFLRNLSKFLHVYLLVFHFDRQTS